jgi:hypothetical protein
MRRCIVDVLLEILALIGLQWQSALAQRCAHINVGLCDMQLALAATFTSGAQRN